jgi:hypothetical protein
MTRRRFVWNNETQQLEEIGLDVELPARVELQTGNHYEGLRATDGTRIDTPRRHREYMKANGLAMEQDFTRTRAEAPKRRAAEQKRERRETLGRVTHFLENRNTRRR